MSRLGEDGTAHYSASLPAQAHSDALSPAPPMTSLPHSPVPFLLPSLDTFPQRRSPHDLYDDELAHVQAQVEFYFSTAALVRGGHVREMLSHADGTVPLCSRAPPSSTPIRMCHAAVECLIILLTSH